MTSRYSANRPSEDDVHIDAIDYTLPHGQPPRQDDCVLHGLLPHKNDPHVVVSQAALEQIVAHCHSNLDVELGGVLLGRAFQSAGRTYLLIDAAVPALSHDRGPVHFKFTADAWAQIHVDRAQYPELEIVGWFHTHPDLGVFFSADDEVVHAAAFTQPWHVGLVVDPVRNQACFFGWDGRHVVAIDGFYELIPASAGDLDRVPRTMVDWEIGVDSSWLNPPPYAPASGVRAENSAVTAGYLAIVLGLVNLLLNGLILYIIFSRLL